MTTADRCRTFNGTRVVPVNPAARKPWAQMKPCPDCQCKGTRAKKGKGKVK